MKKLILLPYLLILCISSCKKPAEVQPTPPVKPTVVSYTVTYDVNGGTGTAPAPQTFTQGGTGLTLKDGAGFSRTGFTFGGWAETADGKTPLVSPFTPSKDITVYAIWNAVPVTYTVTYHLNGGTGTAPDPQTYTQGGEGLTLKEGAGFSRMSFTFGGWAETADGKTPLVSPFTPPKDITVYAIWNIIVQAEYTQKHVQYKVTSTLILTFSGIKISLAEVKHDITTYSVTYNTTYKGEKIRASGLVTFPNTTDPVGMLSFQHGTITTFAEAPSVLRPSTTSREYQAYTLAASFGFIAVAPDYIGFGESKQFRHPFCMDEPTSAAVIDLIKAAKEIAVSLSVNFNSKLFLAGYSQGGGATLSTHRALEKNPVAGIDLIASFPGAGGYDLLEFQRHTFALTTYPQPNYIGYIVSAFKNFYGDNLKDIYSLILKPAYAAKVDDLYDGKHSMSEINRALTTSIPDLITENARTSFETDSKFAAALDALKKNSPLDWKPVKPVYFYHGDADTYVPYKMTTNAYNSLIKAGASTDLVKVFPINGADHGTAIIPYIEAMLKEVIKMR